MKDNKLAVAYRIYPGVSKVPPIHSTNKYLLATKCLESFIKSLGDIDYKMWAMLDNCPDEYIVLFQSLVPQDRLEIVRYPGIGNGGTFGEQVKILSEQTFSENIYFAEDDYYYLENTFKDAMNFMQNNPDADFVTPYDHLDYYRMPIHGYESQVKFNENRRWRTVSTTCMTFLTTKSKLSATKKIFMTYVKNNYDSSLWIAVTKKGVFRPIFSKDIFKNNNLYLRIFVKCVAFGFSQLLFGKKYKLWAPVPTIATHMDSDFLAPGIDWKKHFN